MNLKKTLVGMALTGALLTCIKTDVSQNKNNYFEFNKKYSPTEQVDSLSKEYSYAELKKEYSGMGYNFLEQIAFDYVLEGNVELAKEYKKKNQSPRESILNFACNIDPEKVDKFEDTKKPDALLIYSEADHNNAFINESNLNLLEKISQTYDVSLSICSTDEEVLLALDKIKKPELIIIGGHGGLGSLVVLSNRMRYMGDYCNKYTIDIFDDEIMNKLNKKGDAVCVLHNCTTGQIIAPYVKKQCPDLTVIAPKQSIDISAYYINSIYPFNISFYDNLGNNCTYKE